MEIGEFNAIYPLSWTWPLTYDEQIELTQAYYLHLSKCLQYCNLWKHRDYKFKPTEFMQYNGRFSSKEKK